MNVEKLKELYTKYSLDKNDVFKHKHYVIITRSGIDKIQAKEKIRITYNLEYHTNDTAIAIIKGTGTTDEGAYIESYGEVSPANNSNSYPIAMAEKRAMSRIVLKLSGFYELGAFGIDEAEEFGEAVKKGRKSDSATKAAVQAATKG